VHQSGAMQPPRSAIAEAAHSIPALPGRNHSGTASSGSHL